MVKYLLNKFTYTGPLVFVYTYTVHVYIHKCTVVHALTLVRMDLRKMEHG
jgi:hypothetical protein